MILHVTINGTKVNPYLRMGLKQNPFPQIAKAELMNAMKQLNSLAADPIKSKEEIAERLKGWSPDFIKLCQDKFELGKMINFDVAIDNRWLR